MVKGRDAVTEIGASAMMDMDKLSKWLADSRIDPNDPANSELVYLLRVKFMYDIDHILLLGHRVFNVRPAFFYTKPFVYNSVAICLIMIKLLHHAV